MSLSHNYVQSPNQLILSMFYTQFENNSLVLLIHRIGDSGLCVRPNLHYSTTIVCHGHFELCRLEN